MAINPEDILKQAKQIIDKFHLALASVEKLAPESRVEREECERQEGEGTSSSTDFREIMFKNAPKTDGDCIEAEKGAWTR